MKSYNISFSLLREFKKYMRGDLCGLVFRAKFIDKTYKDEPKPGSPAHAGLWFEQCVAQTQPNIIIEPVLTKKNELTSIYNNLYLQIENFKKLGYSKNIIYVSPVYNFEFNDNIYKGIFDILCTNCIRDIKTTGKIDNVYDGWGFSDKFPFHLKQEADQARMYIWLHWKVTGIILPFYFDIFSNTNPNDFKTIPCTMTEDSLCEFEEKLTKESAILESEVLFGLEPRPDPMRCHTCPISSSCICSTDETEIINL